jgi:transcription initiation factor TFIIIB Brf1 subunit/transcription initiation factor TFIIB
MVAIIDLPLARNPKDRVIALQDGNECPDCGEPVPVTTPEGFMVCSACGCEYPESQPYICSDALSPYKGIVQSHITFQQTSRTMVGTKAERDKLAPNLKWAERVGQTYEQEVLQRAYFEIRRILTILDLTGRPILFDAAMAGFARAYRASLKGSRCRNVHLLALVTAYRALRAARVPIALKGYLSSCLDECHNPRQFMVVLKDTAGAFPRTNPEEMVPREVSALVSRFGFPKYIQDSIAIIVKHHLAAFRSPKTAVRAAAIVSTASVATGSRIQFPLSTIARSAGIATSALIRCITDACAYYHRPLTGSLVHAQDHLQSIFLTRVDSSKGREVPLALNSIKDTVPTGATVACEAISPAPDINSTLSFTESRVHTSSRSVISMFPQLYHPNFFHLLFLNQDLLANRREANPPPLVKGGSICEGIQDGPPPSL